MHIYALHLQQYHFYLHIYIHTYTAVSVESESDQAAKIQNEYQARQQRHRKSQTGILFYSFNCLYRIFFLL
jgi:hypothetical protein